MKIQKTYKIKSALAFMNRTEDQQAIFDKWLKEGTFVTISQNENIDVRERIATDGKDEIKISYLEFYIYSVTDDWGFIMFNKPNGKKFFECKIADYKDGDELKVEKEVKEVAQKPALTEDEKQERTEAAKIKAQFIGLKALTGTQKQKDWAEQIRMNTLEQLSEDVATKLLDIDVTKKAKFWIENRFKKAAQFEKFVKEYNKQKEEPYFIEFWKL